MLASQTYVLQHIWQINCSMTCIDLHAKANVKNVNENRNAVSKCIAVMLGYNNINCLCNHINDKVSM